MIKVIVGYRLKESVNITPLLMKLRSYAMTCPGFVSAENLVSTQDRYVVAIVYTWESVEKWNLWENAMITQKILPEVEELLKEKPRVILYRIAPTTGWGE